MDRTLLGWLILLGVGFPLIGLLLSEAAERLEQGHPLLASAFRKIQRYVLPPLAVLLIMRRLLNVAGNEGSSQLVETATWVAIIVAGISLVNAVLTTQPKSSGWQVRVPNLFFQVLRALVVLAIAYYIVSGVWAVDVAQFVTAVGVGSLAIALALQNTLSNLVSGLLILIAKPFRPGDWIDVGGTQSRVAEQSWWAVTLEDRGWGTSVTIPNGSLAGASITNYGTGGLWKKVAIALSYDDPPNEVLPALEAMAEDLENVLSPAIAGVASYGDFSVNYELWYEVMPEKSWGVYNTLMSRLYYVVQRHGFTIPYPIAVEYAMDFDPTQGLPSQIPIAKPDRSSELLGHIQTSPYFSSLDGDSAQAIAQVATVSVFGSGETIVQEGKGDAGFYLIAKGRVRVWTQNQDGFPQSIGQLTRGEGFGELTLFPGELSPITAIAEEDVELVVISDDEMVKALQSYPRFGIEMMRLIDEKRRSVNLVKGIFDSTDATASLHHSGNGSSNGSSTVNTTGVIRI